MEKIQVKIKRIFDKREGQNEHGNWCYQDIHVVEDNNDRYPNEFLCTISSSDVENIAKLKEGDTIKMGVSFAVRCYTKDGKDYWKQVVAGWGLERIEN
jgi:hypothetical protein